MLAKTIAHYEVLEQLGEGGMGVVYRARDTRLDREVAIKVLPETFNEDAERVARFEREAKMLAALDHPNIAGIYEVDEDDGAHFLAMQLAEGEDLASLLSRGPLAVDDSLRVALQIARALEAAHEKGIVHRDLKPANVMVDADGRVKVLDFGLAKAWEAETAEPGALSMSPTLRAQMTGAGVILGTASYMSPEQARGQEADKQADIWAFGVVLWEMLTGKRLFGGETVSDALAAVLHAAPNWGALPPAIRPAIRSLLRHCLERDPEGRLHDIADARIVITDSLEGTDDAVDAEPHARPKLWWPGLGAALLAGALMGAALLTLGRPREGNDETTRPPIRAELSIARELSRSLRSSDVAISPDGTNLVFNTWDGSGKLFRRSLADRVTSPIPGTEGGEHPTISPDGRWVAFFADGKLKKVPIQGGTPETLCDAPNPFGATWGPDDEIIFSPQPAEGLWRVPASGGEPRKLSTQDRIETEIGHQTEIGHHNPSFLPDGSGVLFGVWYGQNSSSLAVLDLRAEKEHQVLLPGVSYATYSPTGHLLYTREDGLYAVPFNLEDHSIAGVEVPVHRNLLVTVNNVGHFALSNTGVLVSNPGSRRPTELVSVDLTSGSVETLPVPSAIYGNPRYSPDGKRIALIERRPATTLAWIVDPQTGRKTRIGDKGSSVWPFWSPDGDRVTYTSDHSGPWDVYSEPADGSGASELLFDNSSTEDKFFIPYQWSPDGQVLVGAGDQRAADAQQGGSDLGIGIYLLDRERPGTLTELVPPRHPMQTWSPALSPDGRWLAYSEDPGRVSETAQIYVTPFPAGGRRWLVSTDGGRMPLWSPDGQRIYYHWSGALWAVDLQTEPDFRASQPRKIMDFSFRNGFDMGDFYILPNWDLSPDGTALLAVRYLEEGDEWQPATHFDITTDFFAELRRKVSAAD